MLTNLKKDDEEQKMRNLIETIKEIRCITGSDKIRTIRFDTLKQTSKELKNLNAILTPIQDDMSEFTKNRIERKN